MTDAAPGLKVEELSKSELKWLKGQRKGLAQLAKLVPNAGKKGPWTPDELDQIYDTWYASWAARYHQGQADPNEPNAVCLTIGVGIGDAMIEQMPELEWKIITDSFGTDIGLHAAGKGNVVTHPTSMVAKRLESGETTWIARTIGVALPDLRLMLAGESPRGSE